MFPDWLGKVWAAIKALGNAIGAFLNALWTRRREQQDYDRDAERERDKHNAETRKQLDDQKNAFTTQLLAERAEHEKRLAARDKAHDDRLAERDAVIASEREEHRKERHENRNAWNETLLALQVRIATQDERISNRDKVIDILQANETELREEMHRRVAESNERTADCERRERKLRMRVNWLEMAYRRLLAALKTTHPEAVDGDLLIPPEDDENEEDRPKLLTGKTPA